MSRPTAPESRATVESFAQASNGQTIPVNRTLSYFSVIPLDDNELQRLVYDPAESLPPSLHERLPNLNLIVVPYMEEASPGEKAGPRVVFQAPPVPRRVYSAVVDRDRRPMIFLAVKDEDVADAHDSFYLEVAALLVDRGGDEFAGEFYDLLREEIRDRVRGELEEDCWALKDKILSRKAGAARDSKLFRDYARQATIDTLALYMHGLCCDIDVEAGPKQLPGVRIRKRIEALRKLLPPPQGVAVFPEELPLEA